MKRHLLGIFVIAFIMIALPLHLRFAHGNPTLAGTEAYYHARMAIQLTHGIPTTDTGIVNGRPYTLNPYHLVLAAGYKLIGPIAFSLIPILFALISYLFLWLILNKIGVPESTQPWILLAYALSPPLIAAGTLGTPHAFILALLTAGIYLLFTKWHWIGTAFFVIVSLTGLMYNITALIFLILLMITQKRTSREVTTLFLVIAVLVIGHYPSAITPARGLAQYISDLGGTYGFSVFAFLLAIVGSVLLWEHKRALSGAYFIFLLFLTASFFFPDLLIFANVFVSAMAGVGLAKLAQREWKLGFLRHAALLVLFCGLLFSSISHAVVLADSPPSASFFKALELTKGTVLTHENYGFWVEYAGHEAVIDPLWRELPDAQEQSWDVAAIFQSTELQKTRILLRKYGVAYIIITPEMQHGLLWDREEQGLDFVVKNSETFKKVQTDSNIGVWRVA